MIRCLLFALPLLGYPNGQVRAEDSCAAASIDINCSAKHNLIVGKDEKVKVKEGVAMPVVGWGSWRVQGFDVVNDALENVLDAGYRLIDTADVYGNHEDIGRALQFLLPERGLSRSDIFLTSKLKATDGAASSCAAAINRILEELDTEYIDLFLLHSPPTTAQLRREAWQCLMDHHNKGLLRAIGVSNYMPEHLEEIDLWSDVKPQVNQIWYNPTVKNSAAAVVDYCRQHGIHMTAYTSINGHPRNTNPTLLKDEQLKEFAHKYGKTVPQLLLRWGLQSGFSVIPKSVNPSHIRENFDIFDFEIDERDMEAFVSVTERNHQYIIT